MRIQTQSILKNLICNRRHILPRSYHFVVGSIDWDDHEMAVTGAVSAFWRSLRNLLSGSGPVRQLCQVGNFYGEAMIDMASNNKDNIGNIRSVQ